MTIIVEDGSAMSNSESYISVADADTYHTNMGNHTWSSIQTVDKEAYLRRATQFMVGRYRNAWKGARVKPTQALDWPRIGVVIDDIAGALGPQLRGSYGLYQLDYTTVPTEIKNACAELALRANIQALVKDQTQGIVSETVGPITIVYDKDSPQQTEYVQVENMVRPFLASAGPCVRLGRC
jgi:hypothetical protein